MKYFDFTLPTPAENLACDEALLEACERGGDEILRFWEPKRLLWCWAMPIMPRGK